MALYSLPLLVRPILGDKKGIEIELARLLDTLTIYCNIEKIRTCCEARGVEVVGSLVALSVLRLSTLLVLETDLWS